MERKKYVKAYVSDSLYDYVNQMSREMCMSASAFCVMCINQYKMSMQSLDAMSELKGMVTELKTMQLKGK